MSDYEAMIVDTDKETLKKQYAELKQKYDELNDFSNSQLAKVLKENEELKAQIEKMKCCENCKKYFNDYKGCSDFDCDFCDHWEMKE